MPIQFEMDDASSPESGGILPLSDFLSLLGIGSTQTDLESAMARSSLVRAEGAVIRTLRYDPVMKVRTEYYVNQNTPRQGFGIWEANETQAYLRVEGAQSSEELQVNRLPIRESDSAGENRIDLRIDYDGRSGSQSGSFGDSTVKIEGTDFFPNYDLVDSNGKKVCQDGIIRSLGLWPEYPGCVKIAYLAGYAAGELAGTDSMLDASPIQEAVLDEATRRFHQGMSRAKKSRGFSSPFMGEKLGDYSYTVQEDLQKEFLSSKSDIMASTYYKLESFINIGAAIFS